MGASPFITIAHSEDRDEAFRTAQDADRFEYGFGNGADAKDRCVVIDGPRTEAEAAEAANKLLSAGDPRVDDKWGPAGAIAIDGGWLFFGWYND
ncbi:hypothetical protein [Streptomyces albogriseolus]|uniref:hypothetical protein n=1 Tax=Streptomyces albogriseolus TaxID=1887 RepID=UPI00346031EA